METCALHAALRKEGPLLANKMKKVSSVIRNVNILLGKRI